MHCRRRLKCWIQGTIVHCLAHHSLEMIDEKCETVCGTRSLCLQFTNCGLRWAPKTISFSVCSPLRFLLHTCLSNFIFVSLLMEWMYGWYMSLARVHYGLLVREVKDEEPVESEGCAALWMLHKPSLRSQMFMWLYAYFGTVVAVVTNVAIDFSSPWLSSLRNLTGSIGYLCCYGYQGYQCLLVPVFTPEKCFALRTFLSCFLVRYNEEFCF
jgi:hypothetical protein